MSRMRVDRLTVDVLVQAAVIGPLEASSWRPLVRDPDDLGRRLLPSDADYVFAPLPVGVTAVEVLKTCGFYRYNRSRVPSVLTRIEHALYRFLPGYDDAPWGWQGPDLTARADRPAPHGDDAGPAPLPDELAAVCDRLTAVGLPPVGTGLGPTEELTRRHAVPARSVLGWATVFPPGRTGAPAIRVTVGADDDSAARLHHHEIDRVVGDSRSGARVRRWGRTVVATELSLPYDHQPTPRYSEEDVDEAVTALLHAALGAPDDEWSALDPPLHAGAGALLGRRVELVPPLGAWAWVVRTEPERARLLERVADAERSAAIRAVDLRRHSIVVLGEYDGAEDVLGHELVTTADLGGRPRLGEELVIEVPPPVAPVGLGAVVVVDRLARRPQLVRVRRRGEQRFYSSIERRFWDTTPPR